MIIIAYFLLGTPDIDEGSFVPRPSVIIRDNKRVKIGTPVYVHSGFDVIIDCNISNGTPPINITWFHNGSPYPTEGNTSTITITDANNGDVFKCRAENNIGFDTESTTIYVKGDKWIMYLYMYACIHMLYVQKFYMEFNFTVLWLVAEP